LLTVIGLLICLLLTSNESYATSQVPLYQSGTPINVCRMVATPVNPTDSCSAVSCSWDASYFYVCTANNTWLRTSLSTWSVSNQFLLLEDSSFILLEDGTKLIL
jgi:hypothetical protein